jgi:predicted acyl esterase
VNTPYATKGSEDFNGVVPWLGALSQSGDYTPHYARRDHSVSLERLEAATLMFHGSADRRVSPLMQAGLFDAIPTTTPHVGLFGVWDHEFPDDFYFNGAATSATRKSWERADWRAMVFAWFEAHMRGVDNGVNTWPRVQVQATDGQWRTASTWPSAPGPERIMKPGPRGVLDAHAPSGTTSLLEAPVYELEKPLPTTPLPLSAAVFTSPPLPARLELVGTPLLELWVRLLVPDAHISARLEVIDATGGRVLFEARTAGARSARHLAPFDRDRFRQAQGAAAPTGRPLLVPIRFTPIDLAVPAGHRLRLTIAGSSIVFDGLDGVVPGLGAGFQGPTLPSGLVQPIVVLRDRAHPSRLRLHLPEASSTLLDVREKNEIGQPLGTTPDATLSVDGTAG